VQSVLYGIINAIVGIPTMISFAAIVWQVRQALQPLGSYSLSRATASGELQPLGSCTLPGATASRELQPFESYSLLGATAAGELQPLGSYSL